LNRAGEHVHADKYKGWDVDSVVYILDMNVLEMAYTNKDTTMYQGEKYVWQGKTYRQGGVYTDTLQRVNGCDSILTLTLTVLKNEVTVHEIEASGQCADNGTVIVSMDVTGLVDSLYITFSAADKALGLRDSAMVMPANKTIRLCYKNVRAGKYVATLRGVFRSMDVFEERVELTFFYPSFVLEQRWNDVVAVLTRDYNGGYDFVGFQWYKDGKALAGETRHFLHQQLEAGAEYSVLLTDGKGMQLMSCPLVAEEREEISLYPTVVQDVLQVRCRVYERAEVYIYDNVLEGFTKKNALELEGLNAKITYNPLETLNLVDVLVLSPGVPIDNEIAIEARRLNKRIIGELELASYFIIAPIIAVTGTNGKTTVCSMLSQILDSVNEENFLLAVSAHRFLLKLMKLQTIV
jgi:hypothetical protein